MRKATIAGLTAATLVVAGGFYGLADALDVAPGFLTTAPVGPTAAAFPTTEAGAGAEPTVAGLDADVATPSKAALASYAEALASDDLVEGATTGVSIIDVATGDELLDHDGTKALTPASSNKVLTAWTALQVLGADHRLTTSAVLDGSTLTLVGGGDVLLSSDKGDASATAGHAGLGDLARAAATKLKAQGVTKVSVRLDDTMFSGPTWNDAWESGNESWVAPIQPIMIDVSAIEEGAGYPADPAMEAAEAFVTHLKEAGITVDGDLSRAAAPDGATAVASVQSAPLEDVLAVSLKASDNTMTEVEGHVAAVAAGNEGSFEGAAATVEAQLKKDGFDTSGLVLRDSSGLAKADKVPARLLAQVIARAAGSDGGTAGRTLIGDLPVGALDGTLNDRFNDAAGAGTVRAKTGSLDQVASLTGTVVTKDGRLLAFSVIIDGFESGGLGSARVALDQDLIGPLADCGCQG